MGSYAPHNDSNGSCSISLSNLIYALNMGLDMELFKSRIYCHRGLWTSVEQQNTAEALESAIKFGFGIETDIRDHQGSIVISHDPARAACIDLAILSKTTSPIALNIKADGLLNISDDAIAQILQIEGSFVFDGSIPEMLKYRERNMPHALRLSEYEKDIAWVTKYLWLDAFQSDWWVTDETLNRLTEKHFVVVVSPELHGRSRSKVWEKVAGELVDGNSNLGICTDFPDQFLEMLK